MSAIINFRRFEHPLALRDIPTHFLACSLFMRKESKFQMIRRIKFSRLSQNIPFYIHICKIVWLDTGLGLCFLLYVYACLSLRRTLIHICCVLGASQCARHQSDKVEFGVWGHSQQLLICLLPMCEGVGGYGGGILCIYHQMRAAIAREEDS
jgi:hypothetical protein